MLNFVAEDQCVTASQLLGERPASPQATEI